MRPGGGLVTRISEDGAEFGPHMDAMLLEYDHVGTAAVAGYEGVGSFV